MIQNKIDTTTVEPGLDPATAEQMLCAELERILTAAYGCRFGPRWRWRWLQRHTQRGHRRSSR